MAHRLAILPSTGLTLTPQMRQAIALLQMSNAELVEAIREEVDRNPLLDLEEPNRTAESSVLAAPSPASQSADHGFSEGSSGGAGTGEIKGMRGDDDDSLGRMAETRSLHDHLMAQAGEAFRDTKERLVAAYLVGMIDEAGYLIGDLEDAAADLDCPRHLVESVLDRLQGFEPAGVFARDLAECLALQLRDRNRLDPAMRALVEKLPLIAKGERRRLCRLCQVDEDDLDQMIEEIRALDPKPGLSFAGGVAPAITPDVIVRARADGGWEVELNAETLPRLIVNNAYRASVTSRGSREDRSYVSSCFQSASWLIKALHQRSETILKVASEIVRRQDSFLHHGIGQLRPLTLRDVATAVDVHESTVSRATSNKYIATPRGSFEMKYFFSTAVGGEGMHAAEAVRQRIRALIDAETPEQVMSDDRIVDRLHAEGIDIARRTVAKYRNSLKIPSSAARRRGKRGKP